MGDEPVAFTVETSAGFSDAVGRAREALAAEGFGVLTEIDVQATLRAKLGLERDPYLILGACHAPSAAQALAAVPEVGVLLPCNVTVSVEEGRTVVRAMNPRRALALIDDPAVAAVAVDVADRLERALAVISTG